MVLVHLQPVVIVIVCHAIATDGELVCFLIMGSVLPGYMFRYQYCLVGGLEAIVFGSIRWCVWSFRPSSPLRLPHLKCLLLLYTQNVYNTRHLGHGPFSMSNTDRLPVFIAQEHNQQPYMTIAFAYRHNLSGKFVSQDDLNNMHHQHFTLDYFPILSLH